MKIKEVTEKLILQNRRGPNHEGSKFFLIRRGPNPEGSCFHKTGVSHSGGVTHLLIQRGPKPEGSQFCRSGGVLFLPIRRSTVFVNPEGYFFIKGLRQIEEKIIVRSNRLLRDKLGTSDCTGNLPLKKDQTDQNKTGPNSDIRDTQSKLKKECVTH